MELNSFVVLNLLLHMLTKLKTFKITYSLNFKIIFVKVVFIVYLDTQYERPSTILINLCHNFTNTIKLLYSVNFKTLVHVMKKVPTKSATTIYG